MRIPTPFRRFPNPLRTAAGLALAIALTTTPALSQTIVEKHGQLKVQGNRIVDKNGQTVTLRGMALYWSQWQPEFYNANCIKWLRDDWKVTVVRPSMAVVADGYLTNPARELAKIKTVVQAAIDLGIYVIVDFHETEDGPAHIEQAKTFFTEISRTYGQYPNVIYETWNEPLNTQAWATVIKPYHETLIKVIRANDPDNIVLCGTKTWSQDVDEAARNPITIDPNIAYTLHFYAASHGESLRTKAKAALAAGIPLMVTEGGMSEASGDDRIDSAEARRWANFLDLNYIAWMSWSLSAIPETSSALNVGASPNGNWAESNMKTTGIWSRNYLRSMDGKTATVGLAPEKNRALRMSNGKLTAILDGSHGIFPDQKPLDLSGRKAGNVLIRNSGVFIRPVD